MQYTAGDAAKATGRNIATITRAIKSGKISARKDASGAWQIDPSELHRVFPAFAQGLQKPEMQEDATPMQDGKSSKDRTLLDEIATLRERVRSQDQLLADRADQIADLRTRLDLEGEERRKMAAILTDQRGTVLSESWDTTKTRRRAWWPWRRK